MLGPQPKIVRGIGQMGLPPEAQAIVERLSRKSRPAGPPVDMAAERRRFIAESDITEPSIPFIPEECQYPVGEGDGRVVYIQRQPKLKQQKQIFLFLRDSDLNFGDIAVEPTKKGLESLIDRLIGIDINTILQFLGDGVIGLLAILVTPKGTALKDKDLAAIKTHLEDNLDIDQEVQILLDFFGYLAVTSGKAKRILRDRAAKGKAGAEQKQAT